MVPVNNYDKLQQNVQYVNNMDDNSYAKWSVIPSFTLLRIIDFNHMIFLKCHVYRLDM